MAERIAADEDGVLDVIPLVAGDPQLSDHLFERLVDLLVEAMFLDLRRAYRSGAVEKDDYLAARVALAERCRAAGLLPLPARG